VVAKSDEATDPTQPKDPQRLSRLDRLAAAGAEPKEKKITVVKTKGAKIHELALDPEKRVKYTKQEISRLLDRKNIVADMLAPPDKVRKVRQCRTCPTLQRHKAERTCRGGACNPAAVLRRGAGTPAHVYIRTLGTQHGLRPLPSV